MTSQPLTIIHQALAPYRVDIFNELAREFELRLYFLKRSLQNQRIDEDAMRSQLIASPSYLSGGFAIAGRQVPNGLLGAIRSSRGVLIVPEFSPGTCLALVSKRLTNVKVVIWTDDNPASVKTESKLRRIVRRAVVNLADGLILVGSESRSLYPTFKGKIALLPIIQDEQASPASSGEVARNATELAVRHGFQGRKVVLYVGRLAPEKRVDRLVSAFAMLAGSHKDAVLVLVGDGPERETLRSMSESLGVSDRVVFAGQQGGVSLWAWYRLGGIFCLLSEQETFGAVVGEALTSGMPVICSNVAGAKELITEGVNGEVVDASRIDQVAGAIGKWLEHAEPNGRLFPPRVPLGAITFKTVAQALVSMLRDLHPLSSSS